MAILAANGATIFDVSMTLGAWFFNFIATLAGLFISLFLLISHDDLQSSFIEPVELSNNLNSVISYFLISFFSIVPSFWLSLLNYISDFEYFLRPVVFLDIERPPLCAQYKELLEKRPQEVFHNKERISERFWINGEPIQIQSNLLWNIDRWITHCIDFGSNRLPREACMSSTLTNIEHRHI